IGFADAHPLMGNSHLATGVVHRAAGRRAQEIDQRLFLAGDAVPGAVLPETPEQRVGHQARQQIVADRGNGIVSAQPLIQGFSGFHEFAPKKLGPDATYPVLIWRSMATGQRFVSCGPRIFAIACGYEDADDLDRLRCDPAFKLACGRLPDSGTDLCSQPTKEVRFAPDSPLERKGFEPSVPCKRTLF